MTNIPIIITFESDYLNCNTLLWISIQRVWHSPIKLCFKIFLKTSCRLAELFKNTMTYFNTPTVFLIETIFDDREKEIFNAWLKHGQRTAIGQTFKIVVIAPISFVVITLYSSVPTPTHSFESNPRFLIYSVQYGQSLDQLILVLLI